MTRTPANGGGELAMKVGTVSAICIPYCHRAYDGETYLVRVPVVPVNSQWRHVILALAIKVLYHFGFSAPLPGWNARSLTQRGPTLTISDTSHQKASCHLVFRSRSAVVQTGS